MLRLPRIIIMILFGVALSPLIHSSVLNTSTTYSGSVSPASTIRTFALLIALARGGLTMKITGLSFLHFPILFLSFVPYFCELVTEALASRALLPFASGLDSKSPFLLSFLAASIWAPLSPSIVVPNMIVFVERGLQRTGGLVLAAAPMEVATALITFSALEGCLKATVGTSVSTAQAAGYIPLQLVGSILFGLTGASVFWLYHRVLRPMPAIEMLVGKRDPSEIILVFFLIYLCTYAVCTDYYIPELVGLLSALSLAVGVQLVCTDIVPALSESLKTVWSFAECLLFVLTGVVVRSAVDAKSPALSGAFFAVLVIGAVSRLIADLAVAFCWELAARPAASRDSLRDTAIVVARRCAFLWTATTPKATLQASLGPKPAADAALLGISALTGAFIAQSAALAILYMTIIGAVLTFTVGAAMAAVVEALDAAAEPPSADVLEVRVQLTCRPSLIASGQTEPGPPLFSEVPCGESQAFRAKEVVMGADKPCNGDSSDGKD